MLTLVDIMNYSRPEWLLKIVEEDYNLVNNLRIHKVIDQYDSVIAFVVTTGLASKMFRITVKDESFKEVLTKATLHGHTLPEIRYDLT